MTGDKQIREIATMKSTLSDSDLNQLEEGLKKLGDPGAQAPAVAAMAPSDLQKEFCSIWPKADPILQKVAKYLPLIPGVGSTAAAILNGLIDALDELSKVVCTTGS